MKLWFTLHVLALFGSIRRMARQPLANGLNILVIGVALALPLGLYSALSSVQQWAGHLPAEPEISVFLHTNAGEPLAQNIAQRLRQHTEVARFTHISKAQALDTLKNRPGLREVIDSLERNPLPETFILTPRDASPDALHRLQHEIKSWPGVSAVQFDAVWAQRLQAIVGLGHKIVLLLALMLGFALVIIAGNTVRLQILTRREEIEVSKLIGATDGFIRRPFLYFSLLQGACGGLVAALLVHAALYWLGGSLQVLGKLYQTEFPVSGLHWQDALSLALFAGVLCWVGAMFSVNRHLRDIEPG